MELLLAEKNHKPGGEEKLAKLISVVLHPLLMPTYGFALIFFTDNYFSTFTPAKSKLIILGVTFLFTFLLPAINAFILLKTGRINSLEMETTRERFIPYGSTALYYFALYYLFYNAQFPSVFVIVILGAAVSIVLTLIINYKWKISAHTVGIGGIAGVVLGIIYRFQLDLVLVLITILFFSGIVSYARLKLKAHSPSQIYSGFLLGLVIELLLMLFY